MNTSVRNGILLVIFMTCAIIFIHSLLVKKVKNTAIPIELFGHENDPATIQQIAQIPNNMVSTCSDRATKRGPGQKVIAFCFYGEIKGPRYLKGIESNAAMIADYFPCWVMRVYHDVTEKNKDTLKILMDYQTRFNNLDLCSCHNIPGYGDIVGTQQNIWRFLPIADPLVDVFLSRDVDSRPSEREMVALIEWGESGLPFHVMRDHPAHKDPVLAGMWGARVNKARELLLSVMAQMLIRGRVVGGKDVDQDLLKNVLWPAIKGNTLQHDSFSCKKYSDHGHMRPWSTRRLNNESNFVGAIWITPTKAHRLTEKCPEVCRPPDHKDWINC